MKAINASGLWKKRLGDWVVNCYIGCQHGCRFCYCPAMPGVRLMNGGHSQESWGEYLKPKIGIVEALRRQLRSFTPDKARTTVWGDGRVLVSFLTDPFGPAEAEHHLTRDCLTLLLEAGHKVRIQTRSALVERDFDLLVAHRERVILGTSLPHLDDRLARAMEPRASSPSRRVKMLENARARGLDVYVCIAPFMPFHDEAVLVGVADAIRSLEPREVFCEVLNPKGSNLEMTRAALEPSFPEYASVIAGYTTGEWAKFTARILRFGESNVSRFIPWPDTQRAWKRHLRDGDVSFLEHFLPATTTNAAK